MNPPARAARDKKPSSTSKQTQARAARAHQAAERLTRAFGHPVRMRILQRLNETVLSPNQLSQELEEPLGNVSYHVRVLIDLGYLELVNTVQKRGAVEHFYRAQSRAFLTDEDWARLPVRTRKALTDSVLQQLWSDIGTSLVAGAFDAKIDRHLSFTPLVLDEQGWAELRDAANELLDRALELQAESVGRLNAAPDSQEVVARLALLFYPAAGRSGDGKRQMGRA